MKCERSSQQEQQEGVTVVRATALCDGAAILLREQLRRRAPPKQPLFQYVRKRNPEGVPSTRSPDLWQGQIQSRQLTKQPKQQNKDKARIFFTLHLSRIASFPSWQRSI